MSQATRLDYRGLGPFLPYGNIERILRDAGSIELSLDPDAAPLIERWAAKRGYHAYRRGEGVVLLSLIPVETAEKPSAAARAAPAAPQAPEKIELVIDERTWRTDLAEKIANVTYIISAVLKAPMLYRGPPRSPAYRALLASKKPLLMRISLNATDYFVLMVGNRVIAAAQLGAPLTPQQAKSIIDQLESSDALITIYDASSLEVGREAAKAAGG